MLNLRNSYEILAAGQRRSLEDLAGADVGVTGFDYDNDFGGTSSNSTGTYEFVVPGPARILPPAWLGMSRSM